MCASPYLDFEDSFTIIRSTSINYGDRVSEENDTPRNTSDDEKSIHSIILDNGEKNCSDIRGLEWIHLIISLINITAYAGFVAFLMYKYLSHSDHYVFSTLIVIKIIFASYFLFHGVFREQPFQISMQLLTVLSLWSLDLIYYLSDISASPKNNETQRIDKPDLELVLFYLRSGLCLLNFVTGCVVTWKYWTIEQAIFKTVGTDMTRVGVFRNLFFGFSLMIFDAEISLVSLFLFLRNGWTSILLHEIIVLAAGSLFLVFWVFLGYYSMRSENKALTCTFFVVSCIQPAYLIVLFIRNIKWMGSSEPVLTTSSHFIALVCLIVHLTVVAAVVVTSHYYGRGYGQALVNGIHVSIKNSVEYEELRRILFHPINPRRRNRHVNQPSTSRSLLVDAEVY